MTIFRFLQYILLLTGIVSCVGRGNHPLSPPSEGGVRDSALVEFAQGFTMKKDGDITLLTVSNPWQGAQNVMYRYALCPKGKDVPAEYSHYTVIHTPVERVVCMSTKHVAMLSVLGKTSSIKALSGAAFVSDSATLQAIGRGEVAEIGYEQGLNYEKIISLKPDVIFFYGVGDEASGSMARLSGLGQKVVFNSEYLERSSLSQAEWLKFMAAFYNCEAQASEKFNAIRDEYQSLCLLVKVCERKPTILCGLPWQGIWHIPGGESWMAAMIADAGCDYIWKENKSHESVPINIETIVHQGGAADLWINAGAARSLAEIRSVDERLSLIKPFRTSAVYNNSVRVGVHGGNDFFESGVVNPHLILKDMIRIFHPNLLPDHHLYYYMKLE